MPPNTCSACCPREERRAVEARIPREPALAREIEYWEERLGGLADAVAPVAPPAAAWPRIEARTSARSLSQRGASLWESLVFWRNFGIGAATLAAASIAALAYVGLAPSPQRTPLMATLGQKSGQPGFVATVAADGTSVTIMPAALLAATQRSYELWLIPPGGQPRSLGLIAPGKPVRLTVPPDLAPHVHSGATLAVSDEPPGGSPTGLPTGDVVAHRQSHEPVAQPRLAGSRRRCGPMRTHSRRGRLAMKCRRCRSPHRSRAALTIPSPAACAGARRHHWAGFFRRGRADGRRAGHGAS